MELPPDNLHEGHYTTAELKHWRQQKDTARIVDIFLSQSAELFDVTHPSEKNTTGYEEKKIAFLKGRESDTPGSWVYLPWTRTLIHMVSEEEYYALRTNRNQLLITAAEQARLRDFTVAVAGLSIGHNIATSLIYNGIANTLIIADKDELETTNLNRVRARVTDIGIPKATVTAQSIWEINPYAHLKVISTGVTAITLSQFITGPPAPQLLIEEIDDFVMKVHIRQAAKEARLPIISLANIGDRILIDIERYDEEPTLPLLNGVVDDVLQDILEGKISPERVHEFAVRHVEKKNVPPRALESVHQINKTLVGRPQLTSTVTVSSGIATYLARKIALGERVPSGRRVIDLENVVQ